VSLKIYIGWDPNEQEAYRVAVKSLAKYSKIEPEPLVSEKLYAAGLLTRTVDTRGQAYDLPSNAPCSTEFACSRFLVPMLCQSGWALFVDCDVVFMCDPMEMLAYADKSKAVVVVKHNHSGSGTKMGGMVQTNYSRKNWSSVCLWNCDHPANKRLSLRDVNERPGRDLHAFYHLSDSEIGEMPAQYNWLVNVQPKPANPKVMHFTRGGPWVDGWTPQPHDDLWLEAAR
jgi:lipopolysaccharide biosynthesis glycosyltransferase